MNRFLKVFVVIFTVGLVVIVLNMFSQYGFAVAGDWRAITTNTLSIFSYLALIFLGFFYLLDRGN